MFESPMHETPPVWMTNDIGGKIDVHEKYIYIKFSHSLSKEYRIDAEYLYKHLRNNPCEFPHGGLVFIPLLGGEEPELSIVNDTTTSNKDNAVVSRKEFMEALYCCFD